MSQHEPFVGIPITRRATQARVAVSGSAPVPTLHVGPARVHLGASNRSTLIALTNRGKTRLALELRVHAWDESPTGHRALTPSEGLTLSETTLVLLPAETRRVRVAFDADAPELELSYRVTIDELARADSQTAKVRSQTSIPVFVQARDGLAEPAIRDAHFDGATLRFALANTGSRYFEPRTLRVVWPATSAPHEEALADVFLLAGHARRYAVDVPTQAPIERAIIQVETDSDGTVEQAARRTAYTF